MIVKCQMAELKNVKNRLFVILILTKSKLKISFVK